MMMMAGLTLFTDNEGEDEGHADAAFSRIDALCRRGRQCRRWSALCSSRPTLGTDGNMFGALQ